MLIKKNIITYYTEEKMTGKKKRKPALRFSIKLFKLKRDKSNSEFEIKE
jgi:hypothetical protein